MMMITGPTSDMEVHCMQPLLAYDPQEDLRSKGSVKKPGGCGGESWMMAFNVIGTARLGWIFPGEQSSLSISRAQAMTLPVHSHL